jgi:uncharacterized membrane protein
LNDVILARTLHVLAIIHWIGGLAFVTLVVLPVALSRSTAEEAATLFENIERRFAAQVRISVPLAGASGLWMTYRLELWDRFVDPQFLWMWAMLILWLMFMLMLFVIEPLSQARFKRDAREAPISTLRRIGRLHHLLLSLAAVTAFAAVAGANGFTLF